MRKIISILSYALLAILVVVSIFHFFTAIPAVLDTNTVAILLEKVF